MTESTELESTDVESTDVESTDVESTEVESTDLESTDVESTDAEVSDEATGPTRVGGAFASDEEPTEQELVDEGDLAADYIEELLDIADLDGDIDIDARAGRAYVSVTATGDANLRQLSKPDTVSALQELTRLAVQNRTGRFSRLILDVGGSREARAAELASLVEHAVSRIDGGAASASLPPMSSYERKIVHDLVAERGFTSESEGEGRDRHTVISRG